MRTLSDLEASIWRTLCWFFLFEYPLTAFEVWKWLDRPARPYTLGEVYEALADSDGLKERVVFSGGFYGRAGGRPIPELVATRQERFLDAVRKFGKLKRAARWFMLLPSVEAVAAANTLALWHTRPDSDIDLYIVVRPGSIWSTRFLLVAPFALFGRRPGKQQSRDPFCFSFFATSDALACASLQWLGGDPYLAHWCASIEPIVDRANVFARFTQENAWTTQHVPNAVVSKPHPYLRVRPSAPLPCRADAAEDWYRRMQTRRLPGRIKAMMNQDSRVVVGDAMLKFHENDRRLEYRTNFESLIEDSVIARPERPKQSSFKIASSLRSSQ